jgi:hypothetical protein
MSPEIQSRVIDRLIATGKWTSPGRSSCSPPWKGPDQLDGFLDKKTSIALPERADVKAQVPMEPPGAYVSSISVEGFAASGRPRH